MAKRKPKKTSGELVPAKKKETNSLIAVIARAASDPNVDVTKMEKLLEMHTKIVARDAETAFNIAMNSAQSKISRITADAENKQTQSRYATYAKLDKFLRPVYIEEGFSLSFDTDPKAPDDKVHVLCYVSHSAGHSRTYHALVPSDGKGAKGGDVMTKTHAFGSGLQYGSRYLLKSIFNVAIGEDDDGNGASGPKLTESQAEEIGGLIISNDAASDAFFQYLSKIGKTTITSVSEIPASMYKDAKLALVNKGLEKAKEESHDKILFCIEQNDGAGLREIFKKYDADTQVVLHRMYSSSQRKRIKTLMEKSDAH